MKRLSALLVFTVLAGACAGEDSMAPSGPQILRFEASEGRVGPGQRFLLEWSVVGADSITITTREGMLIVGGSEESEGRAMVGPLLADTTYVLRAEGPGGRSGASVQVAIDYPQPQISRFEAQPSVILVGDPAFLFWQTQDGTNLRIVDDTGAQIYEGNEPTGSATIAVDITTLYTLTLSGPGGSATATTSVEVRGVPPQIRAFSAEPTQIFVGDASLLSWRSVGALEVIVLDDGGQELFRSPDNVGTFSVTPTVDTTYQLIATNEEGMDQDQVTVEVRELEPPKIVDLRAQPEVVGLGMNTALSWTMSGVQSYRIFANGVQVLTQGTAGELANEPVAVTSTRTTFRVEVENRLGTAQAEIDVLGHRRPSVDTFTATPVLLGSPGTVSLSWSVRDLAELDILQDGLPLPGFTPLRFSGPTVNDSGSASAVITDLSHIVLSARSAGGVRLSQELVVVGEAEVEINDTPGLAMTLTATQGRVRAALSTPSDPDVYRLDVPDDGRVYARILSGHELCGLDTRLTLTSTDGLTSLVMSQGGGPGGCSVIDPEVEPAATGLSAGYYYLVVGSGTSTTSGPYALEYEVRKPTCGDQRVEGTEQCDDGNQIDGDGCGSSCILELSGVVVAPGATVSLNHPGAVSAVNVAVDISAPGQAILARANDPGAGTCNLVDTHLRLYSPSLAVLGERAGGGITGSAGTCAAILQPQDTFAADLAPGRYYLQVRSENAVSGPLDLVVNIDNPACGNGRLETRAQEQCDDGNLISGDGCSATCLSEASQLLEQEPNDTQADAMATGLVPGGTLTIQGGNNPAGDDDVFSFNVPAQTTLILSARTFTVAGQPLSCDSQLTDTRMYLETEGVEVTSPTQPGALAFNDDIDNPNNIWCSQLVGAPLNGGPQGATYYLRIQGWRDLATTQYYLRIQLSP